MSKLTDGQKHRIAEGGGKYIGVIDVSGNPPKPEDLIWLQDGKVIKSGGGDD